MLILVLLIAYIGGVFTIISPCIIPILPFVFARSDQPFRSNGLPMLLGMVFTFIGFAFLSVIGSSWIIEAGAYGKFIALVIFTLLSFTLIFAQFSEWLFSPIVNLGNQLQNKLNTKTGFGSSLLIGVAIGLLWTPCAGPILGLVLTSAALGGANITTLILLLFFSLGALTSLGLIFLASSQIIKYLKKGFGVREGIKKLTGIIILCLVTSLCIGLDSKIPQLNYLNIDSIQEQLLKSLPQNSTLNN